MSARARARTTYATEDFSRKVILFVQPGILWTRGEVNDGQNFCFVVDWDSLSFNV
jgi:hypothetical protein